MDQVLARLEQICARLEAVEAKVGAGGAGAGAAAAPVAAGEDSPAAKAWDNLIASYWAPFEASTNAVGGENVKKQVSLISGGNAKVRCLINLAAQAKKPSVDELKKLIAPLADIIKQVKDLRESNRRDKQWEHLSTFSEVVAFFNWVVVEPTPAPYAKECLDSALFWSNKVLVQFKGKDETQVAWCTQLKEFFEELQKYIKQFHTTGLAWNANGKDASQVCAAGGAAKAAGGPPPPPAAGPPPPGPPPPPAAGAPSGSGSGKKGADPNALFAELNKGAAITSGLKKVTKDMQTHKNPGLRAGGVVKEAPKKEAAAPKYGAGAGAKKLPPKGPVLEGNKWVIEYHDGNHDIILPVDEIEAKQSIYIYKCDNCTIQIPAKVNSVVMDTCKRAGIAFQAVISGCEVVNSQSVKIQSQGKIPNFAVDKCSSIQIILSHDSLDAQVVTSKCDSVNIMFPKEDDMFELPVPEQFVTTLKDHKLVTTTLEHE